MVVFKLGSQGLMFHSGALKTNKGREVGSGRPGTAALHELIEFYLEAVFKCADMALHTNLI